MPWKELLYVYISDNLSINIEIGGLLILLLALLGAILLIAGKSRDQGLIVGEIELDVQLGGVGKVSIKPNHEVAQIAHHAWTELITRKAGLLFDPKHDLIVEIYDSWYQLFGEIRSLIKQVPAKHLKRANTQKLVGLLVDSLNMGLRPHLTEWQSKFRRWYCAELEKASNAKKTPQGIQRKYPHYNELEADLLRINQGLVAYTSEIKKLIR